MTGYGEIQIRGTIGTRSLILSSRLSKLLEFGNMVKYIIPFTVIAILSYSVAQGQPRPAAVEEQGNHDKKNQKSDSDDGLIKLNFPEGVQIKVLIDYVSDRLRKNILYSDSVGQKQITILSPVAIPPESLLGFLRSILKMSGFSLVDAEEAGWLKIIANEDFLESSGDVKEDMGVLLDAKDMAVLTQVFQLKHASPQDVNKTIKPFLSKPGGGSFEISSSNILIVTDYAGNIRRISKLISLVDRPGGQVEVIFILLKNSEPEELVKSLNQLLKQKRELENKGTSRVPRRSRDQAGSGVIAFPRTNQVAVIVEPWNKAEVLNFIKILDSPSEAKKELYHFIYISPSRVMSLVDSVFGKDFKGRYESAFDEESGILLVSGPEKLHLQIEALKNELDVPENDPLHREIKFYVVKNAIAMDILATIEALNLGASYSESLLREYKIKSGLPGETFTGPNAPPSGLNKPLPKPPSFRSSKKDKKQQPQWNSGSSNNQEPFAVVTADLNTNSIIVIAPKAIQGMYEELIKKLDKRRPQVLIEVTMVTLSKTESLSLGVELLKAGTISGADYLMFSSFGFSTPDLVTGSLALKPGLGFNGTIINAGVFSAVVRAMSASTHAKVVSSPRILVNDNATAKLTSIQEQPFTSVNASDTVATTSFAGYAEAGSTLTVTPHISEGDHLNLQYTVTLNSFDGEAIDGIPAPRKTNELNSEVTVPDGYVVVVGGLTFNEKSRIKTKVPLLGDIPYFGELFSRREDSDSETVLFVFIRPIILRDDEFKSLKYISEVNLEKAEMKSNYPTSDPLIMN